MRSGLTVEGRADSIERSGSGCAADRQVGAVLRSDLKGLSSQIVVNEDAVVFVVGEGAGVIAGNGNGPARSGCGDGRIGTDGDPNNILVSGQTGTDEIDFAVEDDSPGLGGNIGEI